MQPVQVIHTESVLTATSFHTSSYYSRPSSGSIGSPTVVIDLKRYLYLRGSWGPSLRSIRIAVGAVWKMFTPRRSAMRHGRPASGKVGTPSYSTPVAAFASGPYTIYECPVIQPMSAMHQYTSSG